jgi:hypothetical protein
MSKSQHVGETPETQNQNNAMSDDPADGHRLTDKPEAIEPSAAERPPEQDAQNQDRIEEFGRRGTAAAAKE